MKNLILRAPLTAFFILAFLFSWLIALPPLLAGLPFQPFQTAGAFGPFLAAILVALARGGEDFAALVRRMTHFRVGVVWYLLAIFGYVLLYLLVTGLAGAPLLQSLADRWTMIFTVYLPALFTTYLINPIGEETGWTGYALPELQKRLSPWLSAIVLGALWGLWHLPAYFVPSEMGAFNPIGFLFFVLQAILTRIVWTFIVNKSDGSGVIGILLHASSNAVSLALIPQLLPPPTPEQMASSGLLLLAFLLLISILILIFTRSRLSYRESWAQG
jgi:membrane protease YdiL (CAAX protease family)